MSIDKAYNAWANTYDSNSNKTRDLEAEVIRQTLETKHYARALELGCGTGKNTQWLVSKANEVLALDFSEGMMAKAKNLLKDANVTFQQCDLNEKWPVEAQAVNLITCSLVLEHIKDLVHIFKEANRVMKPEALFYICELHPFKQYNGSKARFETDLGTQELEVYTHHISAYLEAAKIANFKLVELREHFDDIDKLTVPRLVSFVFQKSDSA